MKTFKIRKQQSSEAICHGKGLLYHFYKSARRTLACSALCVTLCLPCIGFNKTTQTTETQPAQTIATQTIAMQDITFATQGSASTIWGKKQHDFDTFIATAGVGSQNHTSSLYGTNPLSNSEELLRLPTQIEIGDDFVIIHDTHTKKLNLYSHTGSAEPLEFVCSSQPLEILDMQLSLDRLFILRKEGNTRVLSEVNTETLATTDFSFSASFNLTSSVFATNSDCSAVYFYFRKL